MQALTASLAALAPALLLAVGLVPGAWADRHAAPMRRAAAAAAWAALAAAVAAAAGQFALGPVAHVFTAIGPAAGPRLGLGVYLDALSALMLVLVAFVGAVVVRYARNYLDGDPGQGRFVKWLCLTLAAALALIVSGSLPLFAAAWIATSLCLHRLLVFYPERPAAQLAARKKFVLSRLGDACLVGAAVLAWRAFGSVEFDALLAAARAFDAQPASAAQAALVPWIAALLVLAALLKSAQFPFHGWLTEVMETPTPVSALLHAGIVNAGGFLVLRLADVVSLWPTALAGLAVVGALTALFGSVVMLTQSSVKTALAYSTVAQMGFMLLQCGLGAFSSAVLHIVAHSLYKAHAFLSSGGTVGRVRQARAAPGARAPHPGRLLGVLIGAALLAVAGALVFGVSPLQRPGLVMLGAIVLMSAARLAYEAAVANPAAGADAGARAGAGAGAGALARGAGLAVLACAAYFTLQAGFAHLLQPVFAWAEPLRGAAGLALCAAVVALFMAALVLQAQASRRPDDPRWLAARVHLSNGLYVNTAANRLVRRLWPFAQRLSTSPSTRP